MRMRSFHHVCGTSAHTTTAKTPTFFLANAGALLVADFHLAVPLGIRKGGIAT